MLESVDDRRRWVATLDERLVELLITDKSTGERLRWATDIYSQLGSGYGEDDYLTPGCVTGSGKMLVRSRVEKTADEQTARTRNQAEVFTPSWVCNEQNNLVDSSWFGHEAPFNSPTDCGWETKLDPIEFGKGRTWKGYIDKRVLEVSCGEAPYLVSRYDATTGSIFRPYDRIGLLDRKLRIVDENADDDDEWAAWALRAFQATYGYDLQGDNVLLARENLLATFDDHAAERHGYGLMGKLRARVANVISWNIFQMDALTMTVPFSSRPKGQQSLFTLFGEDAELEAVPCRVYDWRAKKSLEFRDLVKG